MLFVFDTVQDNGIKELNVREHFVLVEVNDYSILGEGKHLYEVLLEKVIKNNFQIGTYGSMFLELLVMKDGREGVIIKEVHQGSVVAVLLKGIEEEDSNRLGEGL